MTGRMLIHLRKALLEQPPPSTGAPPGSYNMQTLQKPDRSQSQTISWHVAAQSRSDESTLAGSGYGALETGAPMHY